MPLTVTLCTVSFIVPLVIFFFFFRGGGLRMGPQIKSVRVVKNLTSITLCTICLHFVYNLSSSLCTTCRHFAYNFAIRLCTICHHFDCAVLPCCRFRYNRFWTVWFEPFMLHTYDQCPAISINKNIERRVCYSGFSCADRTQSWTFVVLRLIFWSVWTMSSWALWSTLCWPNPCAGVSTFMDTLINVLISALANTLVDVLFSTLINALMNTVTTGAKSLTKASAVDESGSLVVILTCRVVLLVHIG